MWLTIRKFESLENCLSKVGDQMSKIYSDKWKAKKDARKRENEEECKEKKTSSLLIVLNSSISHIIHAEMWQKLKIHYKQNSQLHRHIHYENHCG